MVLEKRFNSFEARDLVVAGFNCSSGGSEADSVHKGLSAREACRVRPMENITTTGGVRCLHCKCGIVASFLGSIGRYRPAALCATGDQDHHAIDSPESYRRSGSICPPSDLPGKIL